MNPHQFSVWTEALNRDHLGHVISLDVDGHRAWYEIVGITLLEHSVALIIRLDSDTRAVRDVPLEKLVHLMPPAGDTDA